MNTANIPSRRRKKQRNGYGRFVYKTPSVILSFCVCLKNVFSVTWMFSKKTEQNSP